MENTRKKQFVGITYVLLSTLLLATAPNAAKVAYLEGANPQAVITARTASGVVILAAYLFICKQGTDEMWTVFRRSPLSGLAALLVSIGFMGAVAFIDVSLTVLIFYLHVFVVAIIGHFRRDISLNLRLICLILLSLVGLGLVLGVTLDTLNFTGLSLGLIGMISAAVMIVMVGEQSQKVGPITANFIMSSWALGYILCGILVAPVVGLDEGIVFPETVLGWFCLSAAGIAVTLGFVCFFIGAGYIGITRAVILTISEPVIAILIAILFLRETLSFVQWSGVAIIVSCLYLFEESGRSPSRKNP